ncbi:hypothetical protein BDF20DRAFT_844254 [Mycotypha africana]|uniref:uncharacterized protein n=1 Tax=Mycotypha africana TaxID=64632 RepID=UPI0023000D4C|nr:uncharacterized protein BDF20DRAFT_844254 [Mycotypha africana]KAI8991363.1 hypothetical protein BDF20DRAFT_844254 [Mycotypha africana]
MRRPPTHRIFRSAVLSLLMALPFSTMVHARYLNLTVLSPKPHELYHPGEDISLEYVPLDDTMEQLNIYLDMFGKVTQRLYVKLVADISQHPSGNYKVNGQSYPKYSYTYHLPTHLPITDEAFQVTFETAHGEVLIPIYIQSPPASVDQKGSTIPSVPSSSKMPPSGSRSGEADWKTPLLAHATLPSTSILPTATLHSSDRNTNDQTPGTLFSRTTNAIATPASSQSKRVVTVTTTIVITPHKPTPTALSSGSYPSSSSSSSSILPSSSSSSATSTATMTASTTPTPPDKDSFIRHPSAAVRTHRMTDKKDRTLMASLITLLLARLLFVTLL